MKLCMNSLCWLLFQGGCLLFSSNGLAQPPTSPFGQSNSFIVNTNRIGFGDSGIVVVTGAPDDDGIPYLTYLSNPVPNPFNPRVTISFSVGIRENVELSIYDLSGRCINRLVSQEFEVGRYTRIWDGRSDSGSMMPAGVYLVRIKCDTATESKKITLLK